MVIFLFPLQCCLRCSFRAYLVATQRQARHGGMMLLCLVWVGVMIIFCGNYLKHTSRCLKWPHEGHTSSDENLRGPTNFHVRLTTNITWPFKGLVKLFEGLIRPVNGLLRSIRDEGSLIHNVFQDFSHDRTYANIQHTSDTLIVLA